MATCTGSTVVSPTELVRVYCNMVPAAPLTPVSLSVLFVMELSSANHPLLRLILAQCKMLTGHMMAPIHNPAAYRS